MRELLIALVVGIAVGMVFAVMRLPVPAPATLAGVLGIFGMYLGYKLVTWLL
ncbi:MAG TPA: XapX domain-containing protein [Firmicutes bacterium]|jgi:XapX domain-containing protein|nr:XapX domain-containing protein [Bacillota bacterium]